MSYLARHNLTKAKDEYQDILHKMAVGEDGPKIEEQLERCKKRIAQLEQEIKAPKKIEEGPPPKKAKFTPMDIELNCFKCDETFVFTGGEQVFFDKNNLKPPKQCSKCRANRH